MEIDHVFASGAVVGRANMHECGAPSLLAQQKRGEFLQLPMGWYPYTHLRGGGDLIQRRRPTSLW